MKRRRVIHILADGRRKYSTFHGEIEVWSDNEVQSLRDNLARFGASAYLRDFSRYAVEYQELRKRFPSAKIIKIVGFEVEDHNLPIDADVIF